MLDLWQQIKEVKEKFDCHMTERFKVQTIAERWTRENNSPTTGTRMGRQGEHTWYTVSRARPGPHVPRQPNDHARAQIPNIKEYRGTNRNNHHQDSNQTPESRRRGNPVHVAQFCWTQLYRQELEKRRGKHLIIIT